MNELPIIQSCEGCGACCLHMGTPPHIVAWDDGKPSAAMDESYREDFDWLTSAPAEAIELYRQRLYDDDAPEECPCVWLDLETKQCRFYEHRPGICRDFEMGGEDCLATRNASR